MKFSSAMSAEHWHYPSLFLVPCFPVQGGPHLKELYKNQLLGTCWS
ncbi:hypothetical protein M758_UG057300 [Ceratodon purpureus]|nr:hypothetical protein M758_UG057300 [Ceratodon purpureus]